MPGNVGEVGNVWLLLFSASSKISFRFSFPPRE
jgi:hypothetical protein